MNIKLPPLRMASLLALLCGCVFAQPEVMQWGNVRGIRIEGDLFPFEARYEVLRNDGTISLRTDHYKTPTRLTREGDTYKNTIPLKGRALEQSVTPVDARTIKIETKVTRGKADNAEPGPVYFTVDLPVSLYGSAKGKWIGKEGEFPLSIRDGRSTPLQVDAKGIELIGNKRTIRIEGDTAGAILLPSEAAPDTGAVMIRFPLAADLPAEGSSVVRTFTISVGGEVDRTPVEIAIDSANPGRLFQGIGGNFRLQFPKSDPATIDYKLEHLPVKWSRIAMWWSDWDPNESGNALADARSGKVTERMHKQLLLAQRLTQLGIPVIVSVWDPPKWAVSSKPRAPGMYNDAVDPVKWTRMAESIADYLLFVKEKYGVEAAMYSFNEPELGLQPTPEEHVGFIKFMGRAFTARGLATRLLLADTSNGTLKSLRYGELAKGDTEALRYIAALGFHSWGGTSDVELKAWDALARELSIPLMCTESGPDAEAHRHPIIFYEPSYMMDDIELNVRMFAVAQLSSILHWQLTGDYTLLKGSGMYGHEGPVQPTTRFWAYQQLGYTPIGSFSLPTRTNASTVVVAAFNQIAKSQFAAHLVNRGAARKSTITGLPAYVTKLNVLATDPSGALPESTVEVSEGKATVDLPANAMISLYTEKVSHSPKP